MNARRPLACLLTALALMSQACLPLLHAQSWAGSHNAGLLFAFCGEVSPALLAKARAVAPAGLTPAQPTTNASLDCPLCLLLHALGGALALAALGLLLTPNRRVSAGSPYTAAQRSGVHQAYRARAPPALRLLQPI